MGLKEFVALIWLVVVFGVSIFAYFDLIPEFDGVYKAILIVMFTFMALTSFLGILGLFMMLGVIA